MILNKTEQTIYCEWFLLKIANKSCDKGLKYCKFKRKRNNQNLFWKMIILTGNVTTKYTEYQNTNTGISGCKFIHIPKS